MAEIDLCPNNLLTASIFLIFLIITYINENKETVNPLETSGFGLSLDWITGGDFTWKFWESVRSEGRRGFIWRSVHYFFPIDL